MRFGSLFAGIGGMDLGLERAGMECAWQVEIDPFCRKVLTKHWPDVRKFGDIKELTGYELGPVDLVAGGFPCQPVSKAGRRKAQADDRWLWPHFARIVRTLRPSFVLVENVSGLLAPVRVNDDDGAVAGWFPAPVEEVCGDLAEIGYDAEWESVHAAAVGAPHLRDRVFIVAYPNADSERCHPRREACPSLHDRQPEPRSESHQLRRAVADPASERLPDRDAGTVFGPGSLERLERCRSRNERGIWAVEPAVGRVADGVPRRVDRLRALGNAVVPQVAEFVGGRIMSVVHERPKGIPSHHDPF